MKNLLITIVSSIVVFGNSYLVADLVTNPSSFLAPKVVDFSQFDSLDVTAGPIQVGDLVGEDIIFSSSIATVFGNIPGYGLGENGMWNSDLEGFVGLNFEINTVRFSFVDGPVNSVGGFVNYAPGLGDFVIAALDAEGTVLEQHNVTRMAPISTPNAVNAGAFRGIARSKADIHAFTISNSAGVLDSLTFSRIPEPSTVMIIAALVLPLFRRSR